MSAAIEVGDHITARLDFESADDDYAVNVLWYRVTNIVEVSTGIPAAVGVANNIALPALAQQVFLRFKDDWQSAASNQCDFVSVTCQSPFPLPRSRPYTYVPPAAVAGSVVGDLLPMQDSPTILKGTDFGQRWGMGRLFFVGTSEASQSAGALTESAAENINVFAANIPLEVSAIVAGVRIDMRPVLVGLNNGAVQRSTPITNAQLSNRILKTQRRRRPGKGI